MIYTKNFTVSAERDLFIAGTATILGVRAALKLDYAKKAKQLLSRAFADESLSAPWMAAEAYYLKGLTLKVSGQDLEALKAFGLAIRNYIRLRFTSFRVTGGWVRSEGWVDELFDNSIHWAIELGLHEQAFEFATLRQERLMSKRHGSLLAAQKRRIDPDIESRVVLHEKHLIEQYEVLINEILQMPQPVAAENFTKKLLPLHEEEYEVERWKNQKIDWSHINQLESITSSLTIKGLQSLLGDGELILMYTVSKESTHCWSITQNDYRYSTLNSGASKLQEIVKEFRLLIDQSSDNNIEWRKSLSSIATILSQILFSQIPDIIENAKRIIIIPDGALCYLPFELLVKNPSSSNLNKDDVEFLIEMSNRTFVYLPLLAALPNLRQQQIFHQHKAKEIACIACSEGITLDPQPTFFAEGVKFKSMEISDNLPGTIKECISIGSIFDSRVPNHLEHPSYSSESVEIHTGAHHATKEWIKRSGEDFRILHIASHAFVNDVFPGFSGIVLHGWLGAKPNERIIYQFELQSLNLETEMITLSCCNTAYSEYTTGEGILGLAQSLWLAGAQSSVTTLWEVVDDSTKSLMHEFYLGIKQGMSKDLALAEAKRTIISNGTHPYHWAQFIFSGDWQSMFP